MPAKSKPPEFPVWEKDVKTKARNAGGRSVWPEHSSITVNASVEVSTHRGKKNVSPTIQIKGRNYFNILDITPSNARRLAIALMRAVGDAELAVAKEKKRRTGAKK